MLIRSSIFYFWTLSTLVVLAYPLATIELGIQTRKTYLYRRADDAESSSDATPTSTPETLAISTSKSSEEAADVSETESAAGESSSRARKSSTEASTTFSASLDDNEGQIEDDTSDGGSRTATKTSESSASRLSSPTGPTMYDEMAASIQSNMRAYQITMGMALAGAFGFSLLCGCGCYAVHRRHKRSSPYANGKFIPAAPPGPPAHFGYNAY